MLEKVRAFVSKEAVLVVAVLAAAVSCALVPFDEGYASYVDWRTLTLLFCLMAVVAGLRFMGVMRLLGSWAVSCFFYAHPGVRVGCADLRQLHGGNQ